DAPDHPSDPGPTPAASSSAPVLGVGQGTQSAFVSPNLIYPIRCPTDGVHFKALQLAGLESSASTPFPAEEICTRLHECYGTGRLLGTLTGLTILDHLR
ncbi:MAG: hypothetical protein RIR76_1543, partial [Verrucomicrobiota bacterium]